MVDEPTQDELDYWWYYHGYKFREMPDSLLGSDAETRRTGINLIEKAGRDNIAGIESGLRSFADSESLRHTHPDEKWGGFCVLGLINCLETFWWHFCHKYGKKAKLPIVSGYRRVGTHIPPSEGRIGDPSGQRDFYDASERPHWKGLSVDMQWGFWAGKKGIINEYFGGEQDEFEDYLKSFGLWRTARKYKAEWNHVSLLNL